MRSAVDSIAEIRTIIESINETQTSIAGAVEQQTVATSGISQHVADVSGSTQEVARNIAAVATVADATTDGARRAEQAAATVAAMAEQLRSIVDRFHVANAAMAARTPSRSDHPAESNGHRGSNGHRATNGHRSRGLRAEPDVHPGLAAHRETAGV
jgi:hypothetical protein